MIDALNGIGGLSSLSANGKANLDIAKARGEAAEFDRILQKAKEAEKAKAAEENGVAQKMEQKLRDACQGFEAMFLTLMYKEMRNTVPKNELFGESHGEKIWRSMLDEERMNQVAKSGGIGLADMLYDQLSPQVLGGKNSKIRIMKP